MSEGTPGISSSGPSASSGSITSGMQRSLFPSSPGTSSMGGTGSYGSSSVGMGSCMMTQSLLSDYSDNSGAYGTVGASGNSGGVLGGGASTDHDHNHWSGKENGKPPVIPSMRHDSTAQPSQITQHRNKKVVSGASAVNDPTTKQPSRRIAAPSTEHNPMHNPMEMSHRYLYNKSSARSAAISALLPNIDATFDKKKTLSSSTQAQVSTEPLYVRTRQRRIATTPGGFSYIASPLSKAVRSITKSSPSFHQPQLTGPASSSTQSSGEEDTVSSDRKHRSLLATHYPRTASSTIPSLPEWMSSPHSPSSPSASSTTPHSSVHTNSPLTNIKDYAAAAERYYLAWERARRHSHENMFSSPKRKDVNMRSSTTAIISGNDPSLGTFEEEDEDKDNGATIEKKTFDSTLPQLAPSWKPGYNHSTVSKTIDIQQDYSKTECQEEEKREMPYERSDAATCRDTSFPESFAKPNSIKVPSSFKDDDDMPASSCSFDDPELVSATATEAATLGLSPTAFSTLTIAQWDNCILVKAEGGRSGTLVLTPTHLIFKYDDMMEDHPPWEEQHRTLHKHNSSGDHENTESNINEAPRKNGTKGQQEENSSSDNDDRNGDSGSQYESGFDSDDDSPPSHQISPLPIYNSDDISPKNKEQTPLSNISQDNYTYSPNSQNEQTSENPEVSSSLPPQACFPTEGGKEPEELWLMRIRRERARRKMERGGDSSDSSYTSDNDEDENSEYDTSSTSAASPSYHNNNQMQHFPSPPPSHIQGHHYVTNSKTHQMEDLSPFRNISLMDGQHDLPPPQSQTTDDAYEELMNASIIRAIEEEARRRLLELEEENENYLEHPPLQASVSSDVSCGWWEREQLRIIENRAKSYLQKLDDSIHSQEHQPHEENMNYDDLLSGRDKFDMSQRRMISRGASAMIPPMPSITDGISVEVSHDDKDNENVMVVHNQQQDEEIPFDEVSGDDGSAIVDQEKEKNMSHASGTKSLSSSSPLQDSNVMEQSVQDENSGSTAEAPVGEEEIKEDDWWYMTGDDERAKKRRKSRGIQWPLSKLAEAYPRTYMMRDVAMEIFATSPTAVNADTNVKASSKSERDLYVLNASSHSQASCSSNVENSDNAVPTGKLSNLSFYVAIPDILESDPGSNSDDDTESATATGAIAQWREKRNQRQRGTPKSLRSKIPRRETVLEKLKEYVPSLSVDYWRVKTRGPDGERGGSCGEDNKGLGGARSWMRGLFKGSEGNGHTTNSDPLYILTRAWRKGYISNYDYLIRLNAIAGRSTHDPSQYPIMPWVLSNYTSETVPDLSDERNYRDMTRPMGALYPDRLRKFLDKYLSLCGMVDSAIPPFMYGSHYSSTGGVVLHFLLRVRPFAGLHRQLQGGHFDVADRLFFSIPHTWDMCARTSPTEVKELTPEWYSDPTFLQNKHGFNLGRRVGGEEIGDVELPPWANGSPAKFIEVMQNALESDVCSTMLPAWIDLIFGFKQKGSDARKAHNVFYHLTYYDTEDLAKIEDEALRTETELHIADFGRCPRQLFLKSHPHKKAASLVSKSKDELRQIAGSGEKGSNTMSPRRRLVMSALEDSH